MSKHHGRSTRRYRQLKATFRAACTEVGSPCWLCGEPIDYSIRVPPGGYHPDAFEPDHAFPVVTHPELAEDPGNLRPSHADCNRKRQAKLVTAQLGMRSRKW